jgi:hypothetical protein
LLNSLEPFVLEIVLFDGEPNRIASALFAFKLERFNPAVD